MTAPPRTHTPESRVGVQGRRNHDDQPRDGVGGLVQSARGFGASAARGTAIARRVRLTRNTMTSDTAAGRMTSVEFGCAWSTRLSIT